MNELTDLGVIDHVASALKSEGAVLKLARNEGAEIARTARQDFNLGLGYLGGQDLKVIEPPSFYTGSNYTGTNFTGNHQPRIRQPGKTVQLRLQSGPRQVRCHSK